MYANDFHGKIDVNSGVSEPRNETRHRSSYWWRSGFALLPSQGSLDGITEARDAIINGERIETVSSRNFKSRCLCNGIKNGGESDSWICNKLD